MNVFTYAYDANDNRTAEANGTNNPWSWTTGQNGYDAADRLIGWDRTNGDSRLWDLSLVGDWDNVTRNGVPEPRQHDAVHQLLQVDVQPLAYDAAGNLAANSNGQLYAWDVENRLVSASDATGQLGAYAYDALGRRASKAAGGATTVYVSAGPREVAEYAGGAAAASPSRLYAFGDYVDEVLLTALPDGQGGFTRLYHHHDGLYSTRALTDAAGNVTERVAYDPYGRPHFLAPNGTPLAGQ